MHLPCRFNKHCVLGGFFVSLQIINDLFYPATEFFSQLTVKMGCNYFPIFSCFSYSRAGKKAEGVKQCPLFFPPVTVAVFGHGTCIMPRLQHGGTYKGGSCS